MADEKKASFLSQLFAPVGGFGVTFATMFRKLETEEYPEVKRPTQPRYHGRHQLNRYADGLEKCIGCELCAWACPADAIYVEGAKLVTAAANQPRANAAAMFPQAAAANPRRKPQLGQFSPPRPPTPTV